MKVRKVVSVPTLISPARTLAPPTQSTTPIAAKNENDMALVFATRMPTRRCESSSACREARSNLPISWSRAAKARTTRMPPRFSSITRVRTDSRSCSSRQVSRSRIWVAEERQATNGTKLSEISPSSGSMEISR